MKHEVLPERLINDANFVTYPWKIYGFIILVFQEYTSKNQDFFMTFSTPMSNFRTFRSCKMKSQISGHLKTFQDQWEPWYNCKGAKHVIAGIVTQCLMLCASRDEQRHVNYTVSQTTPCLCKRPNYDFGISQGSVATVLKWGGQNQSFISSFFVMFRAKNYLNQPMFHGFIQKKITLAQFFFRHGVLLQSGNKNFTVKSYPTCSHSAIIVQSKEILWKQYQQHDGQDIARAN